MKKIYNELKGIGKEIQGRILLIGNYDSNYQQILLENPNVSFCEQLTNQMLISSNSKKGKKSKKVNITKLKKRYKKNGIDQLFVQEEQVREFKNTFVRDSIYIVKNKIYLIKTKETEQIVKMYTRYTTKIDVIDCLDGQIVCIDVTACKNHKIKDSLFYIVDCLVDLVGVIGDFLIN